MDRLEDVVLDTVYSVESAAAELVQLGEHQVASSPRSSKVAQL